MGTWRFSDLLDTLDSRQEVRFQEFERICRWFLLNAPEYRSRIGQVWLWSDWPEAWGRDAGIDLIAEERDGGLWAIQAKLYDPAYAIKKADVDSFLSESARYDFAYRLLIATTDRLGDTARKTLDSQRRPVGYLLRSQLELALVAWPASAVDVRPRRPSRKQPLPHVREAVDETVNGFADQERGQLIMACGTGKTLAGLWIAERLASTRTLVLVPSLSLLAQTLGAPMHRERSTISPSARMRPSLARTSSYSTPPSSVCRSRRALRSSRPSCGDMVGGSCSRPTSPRRKSPRHTAPGHRRSISRSPTRPIGAPGAWQVSSRRSLTPSAFVPGGGCS